MVAASLLFLCTLASVALAADVQGTYMNKWDLYITMAATNFTTMNNNPYNDVEYPCK